MQAQPIAYEESRPYLRAAFMESSPVNPQFVDFGCQEFWILRLRTKSTVSVEPRPQGSGQGGLDPYEVWLPDEIGTLVPGQGSRAFWDDAPDRKQSTLSLTTWLSVSGYDSVGRKLLYHADPSSTGCQCQGCCWIALYGAHDGAKALRELESHAKEVVRRITAVDMADLYSSTVHVKDTVESGQAEVIRQRIETQDRSESPPDVLIRLDGVLGSGRGRSWNSLADP